MRKNEIAIRKKRHLIIEILIVIGKNCIFANMNSDSVYIMLLCFVSGIAQCALMGCGIYMLRHYSNYQFQKVFAVTLLLHSIGFFNNFLVVACSDLPYADYLNTLFLLFDYVIVGGYIAFGISLVMLSRFKLSQLLVVEIPFVGAMALFAITGSPEILPATQVFTLISCLIIMVYLQYYIKKYTAMLNDNVSNLEYFDLRWSNIVVSLFFVYQLLWFVDSLSQQDWFAGQEDDYSLIFDSVYCLISIAIVVYAMHKIITQKVFVLVNQVDKDSYYKTFSSKDIEKIILEMQYYRDSTLTLQKLAQLLGTNRQYLSNYINRERNMTFYEYINDFRLEEAKVILESKNSESQQSLEDIAVMVGFNSYSTFLRSFKSKYGKTPSKYLFERSSCV